MIDWTAYTASALREMDDVLETVEGTLAQALRIVEMFGKHTALAAFGEGAGPLSNAAAYLTDALADNAFDRAAIAEALAETPEGREAWKREQPGERIVV